ncbi:hypothetical protein Leryth_016910 [Lithospermum erythrorhizon]|nr:hypothetical protein Leryth_016910 [Lithospermum erythrorhizon]
MVDLKEGSRPPWVGLGAAVWVQIAAGSSYTFPLYSRALKLTLGFTQQQLTILGVANDIGENIGYGVIWLAVSETVQSVPYWVVKTVQLVPYWVLFIALCVATNSSAWFGTAVLVTNMRNFPLSRGTVAGILKGYVGLSAAVFTEVYSMALSGSASKLLLLLTLGVPIVCLAMMYFVRPCTPSSEDDSLDHMHFLFTQGSSFMLAIYLLTTTILADVLSLSTTIRYGFLAVMVILLMAPLAIPLKMTIFPSNKKKLGISSSSSDNLTAGEGISQLADPLLTPSSSTTYLRSFHEPEDASDVDLLLAVGEGAVKTKKRKPRRGEDFTFREAIVKADFWLLWLVYFLGVGTGVTVVNNLAQIGVAQGLNDTTILLSLFSFCNFSGRIGAGVISEHFVKSKTIPRTFWMTVTQIVMIITFLLYASALRGTLYAATALLGFCYGVQFGIMIPTASELFGLKHFGIIFNFIGIGNPIGALFFSGLLAGYVYDTEAAKQQSVTCIGPDCFKLTFLVLAGLCGVGTILSIVLTVRIRPVYQMLYAGGSFRLPSSSGKG